MLLMKYTITSVTATAAAGSIVLMRAWNPSPNASPAPASRASFADIFEVFSARAARNRNRQRKAFAASTAI